MSECPLKPSEILDRIKRRLPHTTQTIVAVLGWDGALKFLKQHGNNSTVYFPNHYCRTRKVFAGISEEQALQLIAHFGGTVVKFPSHKKMLMFERNSLICSDLHRGLTVNDLSDKYGIPQSTVSAIIKKNAV